MIETPTQTGLTHGKVIVSLKKSGLRDAPERSPGTSLSSCLRSASPEQLLSKAQGGDAQFQVLISQHSVQQKATGIFPRIPSKGLILSPSSEQVI